MQNDILKFENKFEMLLATADWPNSINLLAGRNPRSTTLQRGQLDVCLSYRIRLRILLCF